MLIEFKQCFQYGEYVYLQFSVLVYVSSEFYPCAEEFFYKRTSRHWVLFKLSLISYMIQYVKTSMSFCFSLQDEMRSCGMGSFEQYTGDDCWVNLSYTIVAFTKQMMSFLEEGLKLYFPELHMVLLESLREIILVAVQHVDYSLRCEQDPEKKSFIMQNATFLHDTVLPVVERRFEEGVGKPAKQLQDLRKSTRPVRINPESTTSVV